MELLKIGINPRGLRLVMILHFFPLARANPRPTIPPTARATPPAKAIPLRPSEKAQ